MKLKHILIIIVGLSAFLFSCENKKAEVNYQDLTWSYKTLDQFSFDITIKDSAIRITSYKEDTLTKQLIKKDSVFSKIKYWNNGIMVIENNTKIINDTIIYEIVNADGVNGLLMSITKYDYWIPNLPPMEQKVIVGLRADYSEKLTATNFWSSYPERIDSLKCGDNISWNDLEYFDTWGEYKLRRNLNISIMPSGGKIIYIKQRNIPIGEVSNFINDVSKKLGFNPVEKKYGDKLPSYEWEKGFMTVTLMQEIDFNKNGAEKQSYSFTVKDDKPYAITKMSAISKDPDRLQRQTKEKVREYLIKSTKLNLVDEAMQTIDSSIKIDPSCYIAHFMKADIKFNSGNTNGAKFDCLNAYRLNEYDQPTLELLLIVYLIENDRENAKQLVRKKEQLIDATPRSAQILGDYFRMVENDMNMACKYYNLAFDRGYPSALKAVQDFCNH